MRGPSATLGIVALVVACGADDAGDGRTTLAAATSDATGSVDADDGPAGATGTGSSPMATTGPGADTGDDAPPAPDVGGPAAPLRVVVVGDLNGSYGSTSYDAAVHDAAAAIAAMSPDLVLSTGDMVAGQQAGLDYPAMWAGFHTAVSDVLDAAGLPLAISPGNHDASGYPAFEGERAEFVAQWLDRKPDLDYVDDADYPLRYAFVAGPALFVSLDSTTIGPLPAEQMAWLEGVLAQGADLPAKIVYGHVPLWAVAQGREGEIIGDPALEQLLVDHGVTLFIGGHHHAYYPGRHGGLHHVVTACVGSGPRMLVGDDTTSARAILALELDPDGTLVQLDALAGVAFDVPIDRATLPPSIAVGATVLERDDGV